MSISLATKGIISEKGDIIITYNGIQLNGLIEKIITLQGNMDKIFQLTGHISCE